jgi:hypothetical protein
MSEVPAEGFGAIAPMQQRQQSAQLAAQQLALQQQILQLQLQQQQLQQQQQQSGSSYQGWPQ